MRGTAVRALMALALSLAGAGNCLAQGYPTHPITLVVPYPAGGPTDTIARIMAEPLKTALGQSVIIENVTGAGGSIGVGRVARASPDGYTVSIGHNQTHVINGAILSLSYDVVKDFEPVTLIAETPIWLIGRKDLAANTLDQLVAWLKRPDTKANVGAVGIGGPGDIAAEAFTAQTGLKKFQFVVYRGGAPLLQDLLGGQIDFTFGQAASYVPYVRNGQLKAYAVLMPKRWWAAPDVPTLDELGFPGNYASFWHGIWLPKGTPAPIVERLNAAFKAALADDNAKARFKDIGQEIYPVEQQNPAALAAKQKAEIEKWWPIIKAAGIKAQ